MNAIATLLFAIPHFVFTPLVGSADHTAIAATRDVIMVVWSDQNGVYWRRFASSGAPLDPTPSAVAMNNKLADAPRPAVAAAGARFLIVWDEPVSGSSRIRALRVALDGKPLDRSPVVITEDGEAPAVASDGFVFVVAWDRVHPSWFNFPTPHDIFDTVVTDEGFVTPAFEVSGETDGNVSPKITWTGSGYLIAWSHNVAFRGFFNLARFVTVNGAPLDTSMRVSEFTFFGAPVSATASGGSEQIIVTKGNGVPQEVPQSNGHNRFVVNGGMVTAGQALPAPYWYIAYDGLDYVLAPAPLVGLAASTVAIADRGSVHVVSTLRRRTVSSP